MECGDVVEVAEFAGGVHAEQGDADVDGGDAESGGGDGANGGTAGSVVVADEVLGFGAVFEPVGLGFGGGGVAVVGVDFKDGTVS